MEKLVNAEEKVTFDQRHVQEVTTYKPLSDHEALGLEPIEMPIDWWKARCNELELELAKMSSRTIIDYIKDYIKDIKRKLISKKWVWEDDKKK